MIAERGWALEDGELDAPRRSVGAPVRDHTGAVIAAIGVGGPTTSIPNKKIPGIAKLVVVQAERVSAALGASGLAATPGRTLEVEVLGAVEPPVPPQPGGERAEPSARRRRAPRAKRGTGGSRS